DVMPPAWVQLKAFEPPATSLEPTHVEPEPLMPKPRLSKVPPGRSPRPTSPPEAVQRNASYTTTVNGGGLNEVYPTTVDPSAETPNARLVPPGPGVPISRMPTRACRDA